MVAVYPTNDERTHRMSIVAAPRITHTTFSLTLSVSPGLPADDELTYSVMDAMSDHYIHGLQEYLTTLGIEASVGISLQRCDYVSDE